MEQDRASLYVSLKESLSELTMHLHWCKRSISSVLFDIKDMEHLLEEGSDPKYREIIEEARTAIKEAHDSIIKECMEDPMTYRPRPRPRTYCPSTVPLKNESEKRTSSSIWTWSLSASAALAATLFHRG